MNDLTSGFNIGTNYTLNPQFNVMKKLIQLDKLDGNRKGVLRKITEEEKQAEKEYERCKAEYEREKAKLNKLYDQQKAARTEAFHLHI